MNRLIQKITSYLALFALVVPMFTLAMPTGAQAAENVAPEVAITQPLNGAYLSNNSSIVVEGTASDVDGTVNSVGVRITNITTGLDWDGVSTWVASPCWLDGSYSSGLWGGTTVPIVVDGNDYVITALATDDQSVTTSTSINLTGDTVAPVTSITTASNAHVNNTVSITGTAVDGGSGVSMVQVKQSTSSVWEIANGTTNWNYNFTVPATDAEGTQYDFDVRSTDGAVGANVEVPTKTVTLIKDTLAPELYKNPTKTITPENATVAYGSTVVFQGVTDPGLLIQIEVNSDPIVHKTISTATGEWRFEISASALGAGEHNAKVSVTDEAGNTREHNMTFWVAEEVVESDDATYSGTRAVYASASTVDTAKAIDSAVTSSGVSDEQKEEIKDGVEDAAEGIIKAAETQDDSSTSPWQTVVTVIAILIIAIGVGTAGYYGYEWWATRSVAAVASTGPAENWDEPVAKKKTARKTSTSKKSSRKKSSSRRSSSRW